MAPTGRFSRIARSHPVHPVLELLPDAAAHRAGTEALIETFHLEGVGGA